MYVIRFHSLIRYTDKSFLLDDETYVDSSGATQTAYGWLGVARLSNFSPATAVTNAGTQQYPFPI